MKYQEALDALEKETGAKREALRQELREAQKKCTHKHTTYYPDASGNNDSWTECDECGAEV